MIAAYGYFLAHDGATHGDPALSRECRERFAALGVERPQPFDGASAWVDETGARTVRVFLRDWFSPVPKVCMVEVRGG